MSAFPRLGFPERKAAGRSGGDPAARGPARFRMVVVALVLGLLPGLAGVLCAHWPLTEALERTALDLFFLMRGRQAPPDEIVVVALDDASYQELGVPDSAVWPRELHARLVRTLAAEGTSAIAFDILFTQAADDRPEDRALAEAIAEAGNVVLAAKTEVSLDGRSRLVQVQRPAAPFAEHARIAEAALPAPDRAGVLRRAWMTYEGRPGLGPAATSLAGGGPVDDDEQGRLIDYYGPAGTIRTVSYYQALEPERFLAPDFFRDRIVFVGRAQATGIGREGKDTFLTPFRGGAYPPTYGVEIHATVAANLVEGRRIDLLPGWIEDGLLLILPFIAAAVFVYFRPLWGLGFLVFLEVGVWAWGYWAFTVDRTWIPVMIPSAVEIPGAYLASVIWFYLTTRREREKIRRAFSFYLAPEMIRQILVDAKSLNLGGREIVGTALFSDIQGFTSISESMGPPDCAAMLNEYFSRINRHVFEQRGTLIKFIGDAVFAIWGAPIELENHATPACAAALAIAHMQTAADEGSTVLRTRVGVHSGPMLVGNLGSEQRFDYTAIGDAVNVASRLEGLNKFFGTQVLTSGATVAETAEAFVTRRLGRVRVAGKAEAIEVHELLGPRGANTTPDGEGLERFDASLTAFAAGRFEEAATGFAEVLERCGGQDGPASFYLEECRRLSSAPPGDGWDGTIGFESK